MESETHPTDTGAPREALESRVLREVIRTPAFREIIHINAGGFDAKAARELVTTAIREDPEIPMARPAPEFESRQVRTEPVHGEALAMAKPRGGVIDRVLELA